MDQNRNKNRLIHVVFPVVVKPANWFLLYNLIN